MHHSYVLNKICNLEDAIAEARFVRKRGGKVVMTCGCFDLLHAGHARYLQEARALGSLLIVAVNSDDSVRRLNKGPNRPFHNEHDRAFLLASLECVDCVVIFSEDTPEYLLATIRPEVWCKGGDYTIDTINQDERRLVESYGGEIAILSGEEGASTTRLIDRITHKGEEE